MKKLRVRIGIVLILVLLSLPKLQAQPGDPGDGDPEEIPLDPGSWVLVVAGAGYGVKKWIDLKKADKKRINNDIALLQDESKQNIL